MELINPNEIIDRTREDGWRFSPEKFAMGMFDGFSSEILAQIVWRLDSKDLRNLSTVCNGFKELSQCFLFHSIQIKESKVDHLLDLVINNNNNKNGFRNCIRRLIVRYDRQRQITNNQSFKNDDSPSSKSVSILISNLPCLISFSWIVYSNFSNDIIESIRKSKIKHLELSCCSPPLKITNSFSFPDGFSSLILKNINGDKMQQSIIFKGMLEASKDTLEYIQLFKERSYRDHDTQFDLDFYFPKLHTLDTNLPLTKSALDSLIPPHSSIINFSLMRSDIVINQWLSNQKGWKSLKTLSLFGDQWKNFPFFGCPNIKTLLMLDNVSTSSRAELSLLIDPLMNLETLKIRFDLKDFENLPQLLQSKKLLRLGFEDIDWESQRDDLLRLLGSASNLTHLLIKSFRTGSENPKKEKLDDYMIVAAKFLSRNWKNLRYVFLGPEYSFAFTEGTIEKIEGESVSKAFGMLWRKING